MSFAKCEIEKMSCDYIEAIHSSRHMLWWMSYRQEDFHQKGKKRMSWSYRPHVYGCHETYLRHEDYSSTSTLQIIINVSSLNT
jgi:hypothetical protein